MSFVDDLEARAKAALNQEIKTVQDWIQSRATDETVQLDKTVRNFLGEKTDVTPTAAPTMPVVIAHAGLGAGMMLAIGIGIYFIFFAKKGRA